MWPFRRHRGGSQQEIGSSPGTKGAFLAGVTSRGWVSLPPIGSSLPLMQRTIATDSFEKGLAARRAPHPFLAPLGHLVSPSAPAGVVDGIAVVARSAASSGDEAGLPPSLRVAPAVSATEPSHAAGHPWPRSSMSPMVTASSTKTPTVLLPTVPPTSSPSPDLTHWHEPTRPQDPVDTRHRAHPGNPVASLAVATPAGSVATAPAEPDPSDRAEDAGPGLSPLPLARSVQTPTLQRTEAPPSVSGGRPIPPHIETCLASDDTMAVLPASTTPFGKTETAASVQMDQATAAQRSVQAPDASPASGHQAAGMAPTAQYTPIERTSTSAASPAGPSPVLPLARARQGVGGQRPAGAPAGPETPIVGAGPPIVTPASPVEQATEPKAQAPSRPPRGLGAPVQRTVTGVLDPAHDAFPVVPPGAATTRPVAQGVTTTEAPTAAGSPPAPSTPAQMAAAAPTEDARPGLPLGAAGQQPSVQRTTPSAAYRGQPVGSAPLTTVMTVPPVETAGTAESETTVNPATGRGQRAATAGALSRQPSLPSLPLVGSRHESPMQRTVDSPESPVIAKRPVNPTASPQIPSGPMAEAALPASAGPAVVQRAAPAAERTVDVPGTPTVTAPRSTVITGTGTAVKAVADQVLPARPVSGPANTLENSSLPLVSAKKEPHVQRAAEKTDAPVIAARPLTATGSPAAQLATREEATPPRKPGSTVQRRATHSVEATKRGVGSVPFAAGTHKASAQRTLGSPVPAKHEVPVQGIVESLDAPIIAGRPLTPSALHAAQQGTPAEMNQQGVATVEPGTAPQQPAVQRTTGSSESGVTVTSLPTAFAGTEIPLVPSPGRAPLARPTAERGNTIADPRLSTLPLVPAGHETPLERTVESLEASIIALRPLTATTTAPVKSAATTTGLRTRPPASKNGATSSPQPPPTGQLLLTRSAQSAGTVNPSTPPSAGPQRAATGLIGTGPSAGVQRSTPDSVSRSGAGTLPALPFGLGAPLTVPAADRPVQRQATRAGRSGTPAPALPVAQARVSSVVLPAPTRAPVTTRPATAPLPQVQRTPPATAPSAATAQPPPALPPALDLDDLAARIYDRVLFRLRRDLRRELERKGRSAGLRK